MRISFLYTFLLLIAITACKKETTTIQLENIANYFPIAKGKYISYRLDSTIYTALNTKKEIRSYILTDVLDTAITDNLGKTAYVFKRNIRNTSDTTKWSLLTTYRVTIDSVRITTVEDNLRFIKLVTPLSEGATWKGNNYINTAETVGLEYLEGWLYTYGKPNESQTINGTTYPATISVFQRSDTVGNPSDKKVYSAIVFSKETYAKNIGLVYKEFLRETWQPPNANSATGYYEQGSYGIKLTLLKHNF